MSEKASNKFNKGESARKPSNQTHCPTKLSTPVLISIANKSAELFHTPEKRGFAEIKKEDYREVYPLDSPDFRLWLSFEAFQLTGNVPTENKLKEAINNLTGKAIFKGPEREVHFRYAEEDNIIYIDCGNEKREQIVITGEGFDVISSLNSPIRFVRRQGMRPLPTVKAVEGNGSIEKLNKYINFKDQDDFYLLGAWIIGAMNPNGPCPIMIIQGEQGSGKTTTARLLRNLIDPAIMLTRSSPRSERDLI